MAAKTAHNGDDARLGRDASPEALWSRCEAALSESRITVSAADREGRYTWVFNGPEQLQGEVLGKTDSDLLSADAAKMLTEIRAEVLASGESREVELQIDGEPGMRWFDVRVRPHRQQGRTIGTVASMVDITDRKVQEEHLRIVLRELAHRSKNLLAVIQGIARQTAEGASSTQQFVSRFNGRIFSLSRAHDVLTDADWRGARIFDLVRSQVALYAEQRLPAVDIDGENGFLRPNAAQYVGLALHELTTNALKYGALSRDDGRIEVRFEKLAAQQPTYRFSWKEMSSADLRGPRVRNFGLIMLTEVVPTSVSGQAELTFEPRGLSYQLDIPKAQLVA